MGLQVKTRNSKLYGASDKKQEILNCMGLQIKTRKSKLYGASDSVDVQYLASTPSHAPSL